MADQQCDQLQSSYTWGVLTVSRFFQTLNGFAGTLALGLTANAQESANPYAATINELPKWSPDGRKIAFMSNRDGNFEIYVMDAEGENTQRLTHNVYNDQFPSWSPDGKRIAYSSNATAATYALPALSAIFVMDADGKNSKRITNHSAGSDRPSPYYNDSYPAWSPNGEKIAFLSDRANGWREIYLMNPDGSDVTQITFHNTPHFNLAWTPDSARLTFDARMDGHIYAAGSPSWGIYSINASVSRYNWGDDLQPFKNNTESQIEWDTAFSPDGETVAFNFGDYTPHEHSGWQGLYLARYKMADGEFNVDETSLTALSKDPQHSANWSPDGTKIVFVSTKDGPQEIYVMDADGGNVKRLTHSE